MTKMIDQDTSVQEKPAFMEFPITMSHPGFVPSKAVPVPGTQRFDNMGRLIYQDTRGTPERLPPVTVNSEDEEEYYIAQGYARAGKMDPSAWVRAHSDAPDADYQPVQYPMWRDGVLYMTAQEDPGADPDYVPPTKAEPVAPEAQATEATNLRAEMDEVNTVMRQMRDQMLEMQAENARLKAEAEAAAAKRAPGRPRKVA